MIQSYDIIDIAYTVTQTQCSKKLNSFFDFNSGSNVPKTRRNLYKKRICDNKAFRNIYEKCVIKNLYNRRVT